MPPFHVFQRNSVLHPPGGGPTPSVVHSSGNLPSRLPPIEESGENGSDGESVHGTTTRSLIASNDHKEPLSQGIRSGRSTHGLPSSKENSTVASTSASHSPPPPMRHTKERTTIHPVGNSPTPRAIATTKYSPTTTRTVPPKHHDRPSPTEGVVGGEDVPCLPMPTFRSTRSPPLARSASSSPHPPLPFHATSAKETLPTRCVTDGASLALSHPTPTPIPKWSPSTLPASSTATGAVPSSVASASPFVPVVPTPPSSMWCRTASPALSTPTPATATTMAADPLHPKPDPEVQALMSLVTNTSNRMNQLKEATPSVDVSQILAISSVPATPLHGNHSEAGQKRSIPTFPKEGSGGGGSRTGHAAAVARPHLPTTTASGGRTTPMSTEKQRKEELEGRETTPNTTTLPIPTSSSGPTPHPYFGAAPLSTAERARRAAAAEWKKIARQNARKKNAARTASAARSSSSSTSTTSSTTYPPPPTTDHDEDDEVEIEEAYDLNAVLQSIPSAPSFHVDGSRYFISRLLRGPDPSTTTAAGGRRKKQQQKKKKTTQTKTTKGGSGAGEAHGLGSPPYPPGDLTQGSEEEDEEEEDAEVAALYRTMHAQERRLGERFQALRQRWLHQGKEGGVGEDWLDEREDEREMQDDEERREFARHSAPLAPLRRTVFPSIPPDEPSVFSATTEDEIREKAAAAEEFVKNHINRRRRQKQLEVAERHRQKRMERKKQAQWAQKKKKEEEEEARRKAEEAKGMSPPVAPRRRVLPGSERRAGADAAGAEEDTSPPPAEEEEEEDHDDDDDDEEALRTPTSSTDSMEETQTSGTDSHGRSEDSSTRGSHPSGSRRPTRVSGGGGGEAPTPPPPRGAEEDHGNDGNAEKPKKEEKEAGKASPHHPHHPHHARKRTKPGIHVGMDGGEKEMPADIPPRKLNPQLAGENTKEAVWGMTSSSTASPRLTVAVEAIIGMLENRADVVLPSPSETTLSRRGDVLSGPFILKLDLQDALRDRSGPMGMIAGAPYFRIVPKFNIAGVAQATASAVKTIVNELRRAHIESPIIWVNLRDEPLVYIHNNAYIVRERARPLEAIIIPNATGRSIEMVERKLKCEVLAEALANGGNVSIWAEGKDGVVEDQWVSASPQSVFTTQEVFESISCSTYGRSQLQYYRWPITQNVGPQPEHFDFVLEACLEEPKAVFIFNCQTGRGRTSTMMQIANIVRFYQFCVKDVAVDGRLLRTASHGPKFKTIQQLISLLPDGKLHHCRIFTLMDLADKVYSMADHIADAFEEQEKNPEVAMMRLQQCAYFLVFSFYCEQRLWNFQTKDSFADWLEANAEIKRLILSIREKLSDQLKEERIGEEVPNDMDGKTLHIIRHRAGNVLSSGRVLCHLPMPKENVPKGLRQLAPGVPLFACGRTSEAGKFKLLQDIQKEFPNYRTIHLLSVRAEPYVVINDVEYIICDVTMQPGVADVGTSMHVSLKAMEQLEDRLRRDVLLESQESKGSILLHKLNPQGERKALFVKVIHAKTPKTVMDDFSQKCGVQYIRIPVPFVDHIITSDIDPLLRYLSENECNKQDVFVVYDSDGGTRTSLVLNILTLYRASRFASLRSIQSIKDVTQVLKSKETELLMPMAARSMNEHTSNCTTFPERRVEVLLASTVCQMLTAGSLLKTVESVIELGGVGKDWNILHYVEYLKVQIGGTGRSKPQCLQIALRGLRSYLEVLLVSVYLDHNGDFTPDMPFNTWVSMRKEVFNIITRLDARGENALTYVNAENLMKADVSRRCGDVLTANFCLKADHFPGCQKQGLRPALCGAPNFRKVDLVNVYGVAITTLVGLHNVLALLGASGEPMLTYPGQRNDSDLYLGFAAPRLFDPTFKPEELRRPLRGSCLWINLREEPILYVGDRPFVFRDLAAPYVNVELTGIETKKIETVEQQLKIDVLNEADMYNGKFLVHDEANPGELVGMWEDASEDTVKTTREVYNEVVDKGYRCMMLRLPVTDEQSPEIRDFDLMVDALLPSIAAHMDRRETLSFVFNCQMGRGRTTTGMVICCLLIGLVIPEYFAELHNRYYEALNDKSLSEMSKGNYGIVNQLKRVLMNGRKAKDRVDLVLEACSKMQNLRTAIEALALVQQSPDFTEGQRARAHHAGVHYLVRYFNLIVFSVYLEEEYNRMQKQMRCTFEEWMLEHPEISTIAEKASLT